MANASELDLFTRCLSGDRRARTKVFKKYVRDSSRVARLAEDYPEEQIDFFHDCFTNLLRCGKAWHKDGGLAEWVEGVAAWTAVERERAAEQSRQAEQGIVRLCAEIECEDARAIDSYCPPESGGEDSPQARILSLLDDVQAAVFRKRGIENGTWEEAAEAAGKPMNAIGPAFCRALGRVSRLTGAPPPLEEDLEPVFSRAAEDPTVPEGRMVAMQLDPLFYLVTPEMQKLGLTTTQEARLIFLWDAARKTAETDDALRDHLEKCHYCAETLRSLSLLRKALEMGEGEFLLCPGSFSLATTPAGKRAAFDEHCAQCRFCPSERSEILDGQAPKVAAAPRAVKPKGEPSPKKRLAALCAILLVLVGAPIGWHFFRSWRAAREERLADVGAQHSSVPTMAYDPRYQDLVEDVALDEKRVLQSVQPANANAIRDAMNQLLLGDTGRALAISAQLSSRGNDPGTHLLYAMCLYRANLLTDAYREMLKAEALPPRDAYRCWALFQFALEVGERKTIEREAGHLSADPRYAAQVRATLESVRLRK
jgi:DNA-directed RNA polymerase specialized sigma24 family protein